MICGLTTLAAASAFAFFAASRRTKRSFLSAHLNQDEQWVADSIASSMPPAVKLGIQIEKIGDDNTLALYMPLEGNTNIHGTAFAGSLYSLGALSAWYTAVHYLRRVHDANQDYTVVLKSAQISYKKPVVGSHIVAQSVLPRKEADQFWSLLLHNGKANLDIRGTIMQNDKPAVEYSALLCAFRAKK